MWNTNKGAAGPDPTSRSILSTQRLRAGGEIQSQGDRVEAAGRTLHVCSSCAEFLSSFCSCVSSLPRWISIRRCEHLYVSVWAVGTVAIGSARGMWRCPRNTASCMMSTQGGLTAPLTWVGVQQAAPTHGGGRREVLKMGKRGSHR